MIRHRSARGDQLDSQQESLPIAEFLSQSVHISNEALSWIVHAFYKRIVHMLPEQWDTYKRAARLEKLDKIPMAMIIDSPWIPGYLGIEHLDYYLKPDLWF